MGQTNMNGQSLCAAAGWLMDGNYRHQSQLIPF